MRVPTWRGCGEAVGPAPALEQREQRALPLVADQVRQEVDGLHQHVRVCEDVRVRVRLCCVRGERH